MKKLLALLRFKKPNPAVNHAAENAHHYALQQARSGLCRLNNMALQKLDALEVGSAEYERQFQILLGYIELKKMLHNVNRQEGAQA